MKDNKPKEEQMNAAIEFLRNELMLVYPNKGYRRAIPDICESLRQVYIAASRGDCAVIMEILPTSVAMSRRMSNKLREYKKAEPEIFAWDSEGNLIRG
jgi:hypothetical protein